MSRKKTEAAIGQIAILLWPILRVFSARQLVVTLINGATTITGTASAYLGELPSQASSTTNQTINVSIPVGTPSGTYSVHLSVPDIYAGTASNRRFAIRFANSDSGGQAWNDTTGRFATGTTVSIAWATSNDLN